MTPITHAAVGMVGWKYFSRRQSAGTLAAFIFVAGAVDLDILFYALLGRPDVFFHQLYSHNILVSLAVAAVFFPWLKGVRQRVGLALVGLSHLALDLIVIDTVAPTGIRPFFPFFNRFYYLGFFPYVIRGGWRETFSLTNLITVLLETAVFVVPALILCRRELVRLWRTKGRGPARV
jgi:membrane-bound metal-dependent hydrolase YbcI (DUF457 family)